MNHRIGLATTCLRISSLLYLALAAIVTLVVEDAAAKVAIFIACLVFVSIIEFIRRGLKRRKFWAWVAGIGIFALYIPSLFFPLGALGMWGLLDKGSRREFKIRQNSD
ncbi:hypothetical protein [Baaleninema simplex]|uniref:hypothetical protein n=1 Tax=Baaleninema simplex TaxID=2862350 RepID=UPI0011818BCA|nr:hypothetical protein [Baaleninema simplex]